MKEVELPESPHFEKPNIQIASGLVNGKEWRFVSGKAVIEKQAHQTYLIIHLWNENFSEPCKEARGSSLKIHIKTLPEIGTRYISKDTFRVEPLILFTDMENPINTLDNMVAQQGFITINELGAEISGHFEGVFDHPMAAKSQANGSFKVSFCDEN